MIWLILFNSVLSISDQESTASKLFTDSTAYSYEMIAMIFLISIQSMIIFVTGLKYIPFFKNEKEYENIDNTNMKRIILYATTSQTILSSIIMFIETFITQEKLKEQFNIILIVAFCCLGITEGLLIINMILKSKESEAKSYKIEYFLLSLTGFSCIALAPFCLIDCLVSTYELHYTCLLLISILFLAESLVLYYNVKLTNKELIKKSPVNVVYTNNENNNILLVKNTNTN